MKKLNSGSWKGWRLGRCSRKHNATGGKNIQNIISAFASLDIAIYLIHLIHLIFWSFDLLITSTVKMLMIRSNGDLEIQWFARLSLGIVSSSTGEIHLSELDKDLFQLCPCRKFNCIICSPLQQCSSLKWPEHLPGQEMEPGAGFQPGPTPFFFCQTLTWSRWRMLR